MIALLTACLALLAGNAAPVQQAPELRAGVSVQLVSTRNAVALPEADKPGSLIVAITAKGSIYLDIKPASASDLAAMLKQEIAAGRGKVYVKSDARAAYAIVTTALDALRKAGIDATYLLTDQKDSSDTGFALPPKGLPVRLGPTPSVSETVELRAGHEASLSLKNQPVTLDALPAALGALLRGNPRAQVLLKADAQLLFRDVVRILDAARPGAVLLLP